MKPPSRSLYEKVESITAEVSAPLAVIRESGPILIGHAEPSSTQSAQLDVLTWIAEGRPKGVMKDFTYKTVALTLQSRRLVTVSKRHGVWNALLTEDGSYYLVHRDYPEGTDAPRSRVRRKPEQMDGEGLGRNLRTSIAAYDQRKPSGNAPPAPKLLPPTPKLIADLLANDGEVRVGHLEAAK